jgi:hypothetical protein
MDWKRIENSTSPLFAGFLSSLPSLTVAGTLLAGQPIFPTVLNILPSNHVVARFDGRTTELIQGQRLGKWTLMATIESDPKHPIAVFEDFTQMQGHMLFAGVDGKELDLPKSLEPTFAESKSLYRGHSLKEIFESDRDLLAEEFLAQQADPNFDEVAACFPPIAKMHVYTFIGTHDHFEKVGIFYGGGTPNFDPAVYVPAINKIRDEGRVCDGIVGGWLPVVRFVYPEQPGNWSELLMFAPMRMENGNDRVQPVWYRISRVEANTLKWVRYFDSYHPFPPRNGQPENALYRDLLAMRTRWEQLFAPAMQVEVPDSRIADLARHSLVRELMTRMGAFPKYGVFDRGYGGSEHDGFPDTFNVDTTAMLEWGLFDFARQYIHNYFSFFVRDDGSILYRGPETGQFGRMLTVVAQYANYTGDYKLLLQHRRRIDAVVKLLLDLRAKALTLPTTDPAYGLIAGWTEADACLDPEPVRYMQPYLSNSTEAERGFRDLGSVWEKVGKMSGQTGLVVWGQKLQREAIAIGVDLQEAIKRSILTNTEPSCLPAIAGVKEPFHLAVARDKLDPQFRSYRAYMEMLYSGNLNREQVEMIIKYRAAHRDTILGIPTCYGYSTHELAGFLSYGHAYGLLQHDFIREYLLTFYSLMAHQYTRGTWTAPETRNLDPKQFAAPYCTPAQLVEPLLTRWMVVFEDPNSNTLWLAKGTPGNWLEDGKNIRVSNAPTRWGRVDFDLRSRLAEHRIDGTITFPSEKAPDIIKLRLRVPQGTPIRSVMLAGKDWSDFEPTEETVILSGRPRQRVELTVRY